MSDRVNQHGEIGLSANDKAKSKLPLPLRKKLKLCDTYATSSSKMNGMTGIDMLGTGLISTKQKSRYDENGQGNFHGMNIGNIQPSTSSGHMHQSSGDNLKKLIIDGGPVQTIISKHFKKEK